MKTIKLNNFEIAGNKLTILAGPCAMESKEISMTTAKKLKEICQKLENQYPSKNYFFLKYHKQMSINYRQQEYVRRYYCTCKHLELL